MHGGKLKRISSDQCCYIKVKKNVLAFRSSVMEEPEAVENYLLRGAYPSGLSKGEKANLRRKCKNNFKLHGRRDSLLQKSGRGW